MRKKKENSSPVSSHSFSVGLDGIWCGVENSCSDDLCAHFISSDQYSTERTLLGWFGGSGVANLNGPIRYRCVLHTDASFNDLDLIPSSQLYEKAKSSARIFSQVFQRFE